MTATPIHFVTSAYGESYIGLLLTALYSIHQSNPTAKISVYWQDINEQRIQLLQQAFPMAEFVKTDYALQNDYRQRIASKTLLWEEAIERITATCICLLDSDVLVLRNIATFFDSDFDIAFTVKPEQFPINTGVMLVQKSAGSERFFAEWRQRTLNILADPEQFAQANATDLPYGAADQMSLYQLVGYASDKTNFAVRLNDDTFKVISYPCAQLNETNSVPITPEHAILHYKGGWRAILLEGKGFHKYRTKQDSFEMYLCYLQTYAAAISALQNVDHHINQNEWGIKIPTYINQDSWEEIRWRYQLFTVEQLAARLFDLGMKAYRRYIRRSDTRSQ